MADNKKNTRHTLFGSSSNNPSGNPNAYEGEKNAGQKADTDAQSSSTNAANTGPYPDLKSLEKEAARVRYKKRFRKTLLSTVGVLVVVAAISILIATLWLPVLRIYGNSMNPTLSEGNIVASVKSGSFEPGDIIAFYYNNKILIKRVIAGPGDWVDLSEDGTVYVNGQELVEPYIEQKSRGETNIEYPYQVPEDRWFVMGDHRDVSLDSRTKAIGPVAEEQIVGKLVYKLWPMNEIEGL